MKQPTHLGDYLDINATNFATKLALITEERSFTWQQLSEEVDRLIPHLTTQLVPSSDTQQVVAILMPNCWQFVVTYLAIVKAGHIAMPLDTSYKKLEIDAIVDRMHPRLVVSLEEYEHKKVGTFKFVDLIATSPVNKLKPIRFNADKQIASLLFTSGTTGRPKAVPNTHTNHLWTVKVCAAVWQCKPSDTLLISLRLSHWYGLVMGLTNSVFLGAAMIVQDWFDPEKTILALESGEVSVFTHVPFAYQEILEYAQKHPNKKYNFSKVRVMISGGGALSPHLWQDFKDRFGIEIVETYGSSETGRIAANGLKTKRPGSPGSLLPGIKAKLSSEGELLVRSPGVFPGYWHNAKATRRGFEDGWWRTGDLAELSDSQVTLKGRLHEKIRRFGYTVSPRDVEWALLKNPKIKEAYVLGVADSENLNDKLVFFIVGSISDDELTSYCKQNLLFAWRADKVVRLKSLPRTPTGKPSIPKLRGLAVN